MLLGLLLGWAAGRALAAVQPTELGYVNTLSLMLAGMLSALLLAPRIEGLSQTLLTRLSRWYAGLSPRTVAAATFGLIVALLLSVLLSSLLRSLPFYNWVWNLVITAVLGAFFVSFAVRNAEAFGLLAFPQVRRRPGSKLLDSNVIIDGRILELARTGFLDGDIVVPGFILRPVLIMTGVGLARLSGLPLDAVTVLALVVLSSIVVLIVQALLLRARLPKKAAPTATTPERRRFWLLASVLMMPAMTAEELFVWIDVLILGFLVSPDQASLYFAAQRSLSLAAFVQYGFMLVAARGFSLSLASADRAGLQVRITRSTNATFWLTIPSVALTLAAGYPLLHLFGEAFVAAYPCLVLLGLAYVIRAATGQAAELLVVQGRYRLSLAIVSLSVAVCVAAMLVLVPLWGITGAAFAMVLVQIVRLVVVTGLVYRHTGYWVLVRLFARANG